MQEELIVKNVEEQLLNQRKRQRKPGEVPYPLDYSSSMLNFDVWDHMFFINCCQSLTLHQFTEHPSVVLDLGCGGGYWAIEAAKQWTNSTIIGFDLKKIQPSASVLGSLNVRWVHGNLLDELPFSSDYFDFVRIIGIGLGVPEDEWQYVLEEVARVMKPGAVLEMIEEDLIFPCPPRPLSRATTDVLGVEPASPPSPANALPLLSESWPPWFSQETLLKSSDSGPAFNLSPLSTNFSSRSTFALSQAMLSPGDDEPDHHHPQDHTRLKTAWDAMLSSRFLATQLVTVLPFYLSSFFVDVQTQPPIQIPLPPNSHSTRKGDGSGICNDAGQGNIGLGVFSELKTSPARTPTETNERVVPTCASMHLAKTVQTVIECKESIWVEYEKLYCSSPQATRSGRFQPPAREDFEHAWLNWESDMMDRIGMRDFVASECSWQAPIGDRPDWRAWRNNLDTNWSTDGPPLSGTAALCRSLRAFVGRKPSL